MAAFCLATMTFGQRNNSKPICEVITESLDFALKQQTILAEELKDSSALLPKTTDWNSKLIACHSDWCTSGFFPGSLWYLCEYTKDEQIKNYAKLYTRRIENQKYTTDNHDVGFMLNCSFGNGFRVTGDPSYKDVLIAGARSLSTRFRPAVGCIQSWDIAPWNEKNGWKCPVIIDKHDEPRVAHRSNKIVR